jgi:hypothetical protein
MQYENKIIDATQNSNIDSKIELDKLGKRGWQLVAINWPRFYFKRIIVKEFKRSIA